MTQTTASPATAATTPDLRGLVLVAHRAFRKEVDSYCGTQKGYSSSASLQLRANPDNEVARNGVQLHLKQMTEMREAATRFGPPSEIPYSGLTKFLQEKRRMLHDTLENALFDLSVLTASLVREDRRSEKFREQMTQVARASGCAEAHKDILQMFDKSFASALRQLAGD